jgi:hypothetical protein
MSTAWWWALLGDDDGLVVATAWWGRLDGDGLMRTAWWGRLDGDGLMGTAWWWGRLASEMMMGTIYLSTLNWADKEFFLIFLYIASLKQAWQNSSNINPRVDLRALMSSIRSNINPRIGFELLFETQFYDQAIWECYSKRFQSRRLCSARSRRKRVENETSVRSSLKTDSKKSEEKLQQEKNSNRIQNKW